MSQGKGLAPLFDTDLVLQRDIMYIIISMKWEKQDLGPLLDIYWEYYKKYRSEYQKYEVIIDLVVSQLDAVLNH